MYSQRLSYQVIPPRLYYRGLHRINLDYLSLYCQGLYSQHLHRYCLVCQSLFC